MLNRLYIVIGFLAIFILVGAFIAPLFIDWSKYQERVESIAQEALGSDVAINGKIDFSLLPRPVMSFENIVVGDKNQPFVKVDLVRAEFSLMEFLRDKYIIKRLTLHSPTLVLKVDENGQFASSIKIPNNINSDNISINDAEIVNGEIALHDKRNANVWLMSGFDGKLQIGGLRGPFILSGEGEYKNKDYGVRINASALNENDETYLSAHLWSKNRSFSFQVEGLLATKSKVNFDGEVKLSKKAWALGDNQQGLGDQLLTSKISISSESILLPEYIFLPDENRPATRLTGALQISLGANPSYNAVISGGVVDLVLPDVVESKNNASNNFLSIIDAINIPVLPPLNGVIGVDILELKIKGMSFADVRIDAKSNKDTWIVDNFEAILIGKTKLEFVGKYANIDDKPTLDGLININSSRFDVLVAALQKKKINNVFFNIATSLSGRISLFNDKLMLENGRFVFDGVENDLSFSMKRGLLTNNDSSLDILVSLGKMNVKQSEALMALIPKTSVTNSIVNVFQTGSFNLFAKQIFAFNIIAKELEAQGKWNKEKIEFDSFGAKDFGGINFNLAGVYNVVSNRPELWGMAEVILQDDIDITALSLLFEKFNFSQNIVKKILSSLPFDMKIEIAKPNRQGNQTLRASGVAGVADVAMSANFANGLFDISNSPLQAELELISSNPNALSLQLGFGNLELVPQATGMRVFTKIDGSIFNSLDLEFIVEGGNEGVRYLGNVFVADANQLKGKGKVEIVTSDVLPYINFIDINGLGSIAVNGIAELSFVGLKSLELINIDATINDNEVNGNLAYYSNQDKAELVGEIEAQSINIKALARLIGGSSSLIMSDELWPKGPFSLSDESKKVAKNSSARIHVKSPSLFIADTQIASDTSFDFIWNNSSNKIKNFFTKIGDGEIKSDVEICCNGMNVERQINARFNIINVDLNAILPKMPAKVVGGKINAGLSLLGFGDSYLQIVKTLTGEGSFSINDLIINNLNSDIFTIMAEQKNILSIDESVLEKKALDNLLKDKFLSDNIAGVINVANGAMRVTNVGAKSDLSQIFGNFYIKLVDLGLRGLWKFSPISNDNNLRVSVNLDGSLISPKVEFDFTQLIDQIKILALENEVDRLEKLQEQAEARAKEVALMRKKIEDLRKQKLHEEKISQLIHEALKKSAQQQQEIENLVIEIKPLVVNTAPVLPPAPIDLLQDAFSAPEFVFQ